MKKRVPVPVCVALILLASLLTFQLTFHFVGKQYQEKLNDVTVSGADFTKLREADDLLHKNFLGGIDEEALEDGAIRGYLAGLGDPYSRYMNPEEYDLYKQSQAGAASGIGVRATEDGSNGNVVIYGVLADSPAEEAGIRKGDILHRIDDKPVSQLGFYEAVKALSGAAGTKVKVSFLREVAGQQMELVFTMTRAEVAVNSVSREMLTEEIGYVQIYSFEENTHEEFRAALDALIEAGAKSFVFDVRNNNGGSVSAVTKMLDLILPQGTMYYRSGPDGREVSVESDSHAIRLPIAVLVNEKTASAAELFAAVLQAQKAAVLVGRTTFGKGVGQKIVEMEDGSALFITVESFSPADGESFDGKGVKPDHSVELDGENFYLLTRAKDN
ncbi:MAG: S41 family peptidase, partial [Clostridia bacterium]|nr:S41 family peptidase [Clostridia bacterium]